MGHRVYENVLAPGMSAVADGAETVEGGNTKSGGEISVRAATGSTFAQSEIHLLCQRFGACEESYARLAFERRTVEAAGDLKAGAPMEWPEGV